MKKILLVAVVLSVAFAAQAFATDTQTTTTTKPTTTATQTIKTPEVTKTAAVTPTKVEAKATTTTASVATALKGSITKLDNTSLWLKDNAGKEWTFKVGTISMKEYKIGDNVEVNYEKDNLKSIAKWTK